MKGVLVQPKAELEAIRRSVFSLIHMKDSRRDQFRISGSSQARRRENLAAISQKFVAPSDGLNWFQRDWERMKRHWGLWKDDALIDRRRALLVTNSYADAAIVADGLADAAETERLHGLVRLLSCR